MICYELFSIAISRTHEDNWNVKMGRTSENSEIPTVINIRVEYWVASLQSFKYPKWGKFYIFIEFQKLLSFVWTVKAKIYLMQQTYKIFIFFSGVIFPMYHQNEFVCGNTQLPKWYTGETFSLLHTVSLDWSVSSVCIVKARPFDETQHFVSESCRVLNC
jgi:hypothetical protein